MWRMNEVRKIAVRIVKDNPPLSPGEIILSAQKSDQEERLEPTYERLANRSKRLTVEEATQLGIAATAKIYHLAMQQCFIAGTKVKG
jgi:DNA-binding GntR family transcriptional regulator